MSTISQDIDKETDQVVTVMLMAVERRNVRPRDVVWNSEHRKMMSVAVTCSKILKRIPTK